ncbi:MAG: hypothetical protein HQM10_07465 [Candidatus Riflebacteria bacterium]|nr:hypothetical protein [Candidatus Riflebacteria bacterium]
MNLINKSISIAVLCAMCFGANASFANKGYYDGTGNMTSWDKASVSDSWLWKDSSTGSMPDSGDTDDGPDGTGGNSGSNDDGPDSTNDGGGCGGSGSSSGSGFSDPDGSGGGTLF